jgi:hypothetical protein
MDAKKSMTDVRRVSEHARKTWKKFIEMQKKKVRSDGENAGLLEIENK